jgi:hypothetical protein
MYKRSPKVPACAAGVPGRSAKACAGASSLSSGPAFLLGAAYAVQLGEVSRPDLATRFENFYERWFPGAFECTASDESDDIAFMSLVAEFHQLIGGILAFQPRSLADLALQARAVAVISLDLWDKDGLEPFEQMLKNLVEKICSMGGTSPLPGYIPEFACRKRPSSELSDPIFAAIERHRSAVRAVNAEMREAVSDGLADQVATAAKKLLRTVPRTNAGLRALVRYVREQERSHEMSVGQNLLTFLATIEKGIYSHC